MSLGVIGSVAGRGYYSWGYARMFPKRPWIGAAGGLTALVTGVALWAFALMRIVTAVRGGG